MPTLRRARGSVAVGDGERFTNPELRKRLDARSAEIVEASELAGVGPKVRNFEKDVHTWNPTLPMWQRSPKE